MNPALVSPYEYGLAESPPTPKMRRGLMIASKILQVVNTSAHYILINTVVFTFCQIQEQDTTTGTQGDFTRVRVRNKCIRIGVKGPYPYLYSGTGKVSLWIQK